MAVFHFENEQDLIDLIERIHGGEEVAVEGLSFSKNLHSETRLPLGYNSEIPASFIDAYYKNQQSLLRIIALVQNGSSDIKTLTVAQQEEFQFKVKVEKGSSQFSDNALELLEKLGMEAVGNMTGDQTLIAILGLALLGFSGWGIRAYLQYRKEIRLEEIASGDRKSMLETFQVASTEHSKAYQKIVEIMSQQGAVGEKAADAADRINSNKLRAASLVNETEFDEVHISREEARELRSGSRRKASTKIISQEMRVVDVNTSDPDRTTIVLEDVSSEDQLKVTYHDRVIEGAKSKLVYKALENRETAIFKLSIKFIEGDVISTEIIDVSEVEE